MTRFQVVVTIGASAVNLATAAFAGTAGVAFPNGWTNVYGTSTLSFTRLEAYMDIGSTGDGYIGASTVDSSGNNKAYTLAPASGTTPGPTQLVTAFEGANLGDLAQYWAHGSHATDKMVIVYHQV